MATYTLTDLSNKPGEVVDAAHRGPVELTKHGKRKFILMTADEFDRMTRLADSRRAYHADDLPFELAEPILDALTRED